MSEYMKTVSIEAIVDITRSRIKPVKPADIPLKEAYGCVLAEDAYASMDQPPFPRSPLDGYAFKSFDSAGADSNRPAVLKLVDDSFAGSPAKSFLEDGCAVKIMTGGRIPDGADCVIRQEDVRVEGDLLRIYRQLKAYENYCHQGEDYKTGQLLVKKGKVLDAAGVAVLASSGFTNVRCIPSIKAAILSTGDELRRPGSPLPYGCIYDSNEYYIYARMKDFGIQCACLEPSDDKSEEIANKMKCALSDSDLLITTGGTSVGDKDMIPDALERIGAEIVFHGIAMKPGMPTLLAMMDEKVILGLSGNPFAAAVGFEVTIKHILNALYGNEIYKLDRRTAVLENDFNKHSKSRRFIRGMYDNGRVYIPAAQGNGQLSSMTGCNCLVDIPAGSGPVKAGAQITVQMI